MEFKQFIRVGLLFSCAGIIVSNEANAMLTGNVVLANCVEIIKQLDGQKFDGYKTSRCLGYIEGFVGGAQATLLYTSSSYEQARDRQYFCISPQATRDQLVRLIIKALQANPEVLHEDAAPVVAKALAGAFSCPKSQSRQ